VIELDPLELPLHPLPFPPEKILSYEPTPLVIDGLMVSENGSAAL